MSEYRLEVATKDNLREVMTWFKNQDELTQWGGPGIEYGLSLTEFAEQIKQTEIPSFCLIANDNICGFGQFYQRLGRHHFGRLAIAPQERGKRLAYELLQRLMALAPEQQEGQGYSLFVLEHNTPALKTYQKLGFEFATYPDVIPGGLANCRYMIRES